MRTVETDEDEIMVAPKHCHGGYRHVMDPFAVSLVDDGLKVLLVSGVGQTCAGSVSTEYQYVSLLVSFSQCICM